MATLTVMCGVPGCGKSTLAARYAQLGHVVLSSDTLRGVIGKDENDQSVSKDVFKFIFIAAKYLLAQGYNVAIDATNWKRASRAEFWAIAGQIGARRIAHVVRVPLEVAKARNDARARKVPHDVIERMHNGFEMPTKAECDEVIITDNL